MIVKKDNTSEYRLYRLMRWFFHLLKKGDKSGASKVEKRLNLSDKKL